ncbi:MAG: YCF48-related protein, partial [Nitrosomonas sp.]|nr:YCF48-related protein [Nitrosomonas sp.]
KWQTQNSGVSASLLNVAFIDTQRGWVVGTKGTILSTIDGGKSWQAQSSGTDVLLSDVMFVDAQRGWVVGAKGTILSTVDSGESWRMQSSNTDVSFTSLAFVDEQRGWTVGTRETILSTADGGKSWQIQASGTGAWLFSVTFIDAQHGWAVGIGNTILSTIDGGKSWQKQNSDTRVWLRGVMFIDARHGWAVGEGGTILSTNDGGKNWQLQSNNTETSLVDNDEMNLSIAGEEKDQHLTYQRYPAPWFYLILLVVTLLYAAAFGLRARQNRQAQQQPASIANLGVSDQPVGPGCADLVGARQVALGLTRFLTNENTQPPLTIAITGEWGSGKSSVMNYLFANLKHKGFRPVWFNAWHHREEQNVLASILANIHQQAIRPWWQPAGLWFRMRMLWRRHWLWKLATLLTLLSTAFMLTWLMMTPDKWKDTLRYLRFVINIEQPVVFSERGFNQLCGNWAADQKHAGLSDAALTGELLSWAWVTPRQKPENSPVDKAVAQNIVQEHTQQKADFFSAQECAILHALHSQQRFKRNELNCRDEHSGANDDQSCYVSPRVFLKIAEQKLGATLTHLDEQAIIAALENLSPESPVPFTREVVSLATALFAALAFFVFKGMTLLGFAPVQMMQGILKQSSMVAQPGEKVGARQLFEKHFRRITGLLGRRRLVLFIDDLDRCDREHTRQVLEMTNFLSSSGELFIVLGMAPRYVLANVTLSYRDLAQAVHEADRLGDHAKAHRQESSPGQSWFARHYLQKLIHIEVPVPKPETAQVLALLSFDGKTAKTENDPKREEQRELHVDRFLGYAAKVMRILLLLGAVGVGVYYGNPDWHKAKSMPVDAPPAPVSSGVGAAEVAPEKTVATEVRAQPNEPREQGAVFKAGVDYFDSRPLWIGLAAIAAFAGFGLLLFWAAQRLSRLSNWLAGYPLLVWLKPLLHRLKVMLIGPESMQDSQSFVEALRIWHPMIALKSPTPRTVKAFVNRLRYMASRGDFAAEAHHEAQMVALATIDYCYENNVDEVLALMSQYLAEESDSPKTQFEARWPDLASALSLHAQTFGAHPSAQHIAFYQAMNADICIHRQE